MIRDDGHMGKLEHLAELIWIKNKADLSIAELIGRPCLPGNIGEYVAAEVFGIQLMGSGAHPGYDGVFDRGELAGKTVNIKTYSRQEYVLDISPHPCDFYLVLAGPAGQAKIRPWVIDSAFLIDRVALVSKLTERGVKVGVATSVRKADWESARIFPRSPVSPFQLSDHQIGQLALFATSDRPT